MKLQPVNTFDNLLREAMTDKQFDPAAENEKQMKQELIDTLQRADNNYVDSAERVRNYINNEIESGEDTHERIEHAKELIKHVASSTYKTT